MFLKLFHFKDLQIDTLSHGPPFEKIFFAAGVILNHFNFKDPEVNMHWNSLNDHWLKTTGVVDTQTVRSMNFVNG